MRRELKLETYLVSVKKLLVIFGERFRTDVLAGWELESCRWFALRLGLSEVPYFFKHDGSHCLHAFGWLASGRDRKTLELALTAGTDNRLNEALTTKRSTMKWPLMAVKI